MSFASYRAHRFHSVKKGDVICIQNASGEIE